VSYAVLLTLALGLLHAGQRPDIQALALGKLERLSGACFAFAKKPAPGVIFIADDTSTPPSASAYDDYVTKPYSLGFAPLRTVPAGAEGTALTSGTLERGPPTVHSLKGIHRTKERTTPDTLALRRTRIPTRIRLARAR
jgi:hypothetical protein